MDFVNKKVMWNPVLGNMDLIRIESQLAVQPVDEQDQTLIGRLIRIFQPFGLVVLGRSDKGVTLGIPGLRNFLLEFQTVPTNSTIHIMAETGESDRLSSVDPNAESMMVNLTYPDLSSCGSYAMLSSNDDETIDRCILIVQSFCRNTPQLADVAPIQKFLTA